MTTPRRTEIVLDDGRACSVYVPDGWTMREVRGLDVVHDHEGNPVTSWELIASDVYAMANGKTYRVERAA